MIAAARRRPAGWALLGLAALGALAIAAWLWAARDAGGYAMLPASFALWPTLALLAWRLRMPPFAWGLFASATAAWFLLGLEGTGHLLVPLLAFLAGNVLLHQATRQDARAQPKA